MEPEIIRRGVLDMQVCVPKGFTDEQVKAFAEDKNRCGTTAGWQIRREGSEYLAGSPERAKCSKRENCVHIVLDA